jgi:thiol-disulfide isomerase/thioredoxin
MPLSLKEIQKNVRLSFLKKQRFLPIVLLYRYFLNIFTDLPPSGRLFWLMKKLLLVPVLLLSVVVFAQNGYEIKVTLKPFKNEYIYLGHYSGKQYPIVDSVKLNDKSEGVFKGTKKLGGGIYLIAYPAKNNFFEILIDKQQHFSVIADTATIRTEKKFINSPDNTLFSSYQDYMAAKGKEISAARAGLESAKNAADSALWNDQLKKTDSVITAYRKSIIAQNPDNILSTLLHLMQEPVVPPAAKHPGGRYDSTYAYRYFKDHYWSGINFWDERIARTPASLFDERLDKYYNTLVFPNADSVIKELDWMLGYASINEEMTKFLLIKFVNRYLTQKYMWEDAVFVHLYQKHFSQKEYSWLTAQGKKTITDRAYSLMANIMGNSAENISLPDTTGKVVSLYDDTSAKFTIVCFWDPTCGHCLETLPQLDSMYRAKWKSAGVRMFAVAKETSGTKKDWLTFINNHHINDWTNVYYSKQEEKTRVDANIPGYSQLYDVQSLPTVYLLDKSKRIVAKKLTWQQTDDILQLKLKNQ